jgi:hypothetical protein
MIRDSTSSVIAFPPRQSRCVWLLRDGGAWLVVAGSSGWTHGSLAEAKAEARWLSENFGYPIRSAG